MNLQRLPAVLLHADDRSQRTNGIVNRHQTIGEQGWRSGESARLPPMWRGFDSRSRRHMWVEFVVGSRPCSERFFPGYSGFPLSSKTNISKFQFDRKVSPISAVRAKYI